MTIRKGKTVNKGKVLSKSKGRFPRKISKGQVTSKEIKSVGYVDNKGELKDSAPVEAIAGIGLAKASYLRKKGIKDVGDFKGTLELEGISTVDLIFHSKVEIKRTKVDKKKLKHNAVKLRKSAKSLTKKIDEKRNPATKQQNWTPRRSRIIASMQDDADRLEQLQSIMNSMAEKIESGDLPESLRDVDTKTEIQTLNSYDTFPVVRLHSNHVKDLNEYSKTKEEKELVNIINKAKRDDEGWLRELNHKQIVALDKLLLKMDKRYQSELKSIKTDKDDRDLKWFRSSTFAGEPKRRLKPYKRLMKLGITNDKQFKEIKRDFDGIKHPKRVKTSEEIKQEKIAQLEDKVRGYKISGFFPTPRPVARKLVAYGDLNHRQSILEPSAGNGLLADVMVEETIHLESKDVDVCEVNFDLRQVLELKGYNLVGGDFLDYSAKKYDRIVMNPPFEKDQDINHVYHAYDLLKEGGVLVSVMSAGVKHGISNKRSDFRTWLQLNDGEMYDIPEGAFKSSFISTGVNTVFVVIEKRSKERGKQFR